MAVIDRVWQLRSVDVAVADRHVVASVLADVAAVRRWLDGVEVACAARLNVLAEGCPSLFPEQITATATRNGLRHGNRITERAVTAGTVPELGAALTAGDVAGDHVDAVTAALRGLTPAQRRLLAGHGPQLAQLASTSTPDEFRRQLAKLVRQIEADDGTAKLQRQQRAVRLRTWTDKTTGMVRISGEYDPETGLALLGRLHNRVETLFHDRTPPLCPNDPLARQDFLRAHALLDLTTGTGGTGGGDAGRAEVSIVIDLRTIVGGRHPHSRIDYGIDGIDLPIDTIRRIALYADIIPVLLDNNGVVLKLGRTRRLANRAQRRAIRAMYRRCAAPACATHVNKCEPHHCNDWNHGGHTDIDLLVPICKHHHDTIHRLGWVLTLVGDRTLTITTPNGTTMTTGPPTHQWT